jgi:hypothetical protein
MSDDIVEITKTCWVEYGYATVYVAESYDDIESGRGVTVDRDDLEEILRQWPSDD